MFLHHLFHQIEESIDIHIGVMTILIQFVEIVEDPFIVFCNHSKNILKVQR